MVPGGDEEPGPISPPSLWTRESVVEVQLRETDQEFEKVESLTTEVWEALDSGVATPLLFLYLAPVTLSGRLTRLTQDPLIKRIPCED